jgi:hypothetical protein
MPFDQQIDQQMLELRRDARIRVGARQQRRRAGDEHQLLVPRGERGVADVQHRVERRARIAGQRADGRRVDAQHELLAVGRQHRIEALAGRAQHARLAVDAEPAPHRGDLRMPGQTEHQQVIAVDRVDLHAHRVAERDRADPEPAEPHEVHVRGALHAPARQQRVRLHHARDALARLVEIAGFEQPVRAQRGGSNDVGDMGIGLGIDARFVPTNGSRTGGGSRVSSC